MSFNRIAATFPELYSILLNQNPTAYTSLTGVNQAWGGKFTPQSSTNISGVWLNWFSTQASSGLTFQLSIEPQELGAGKPSGVPYDVNATVSFRPPLSANKTWQFVSFPTTPTGGFIPNNSYWVVVINTSSGTLASINGDYGVGKGGMQGTCTSDGTPNASGRSNFALGGNSPIMTFVLADGTSTCYNFVPFHTVANGASQRFYHPIAMGSKFIVPSGQIWSLASVDGFFVGKGGSLVNSGLLILSLYDSYNNIIASGFIPPINLINGAGVSHVFPSPINLTSGLYRVIYTLPYFIGDSSANFCALRNTTLNDSGLSSPQMLFTGTSNISGSPIVWNLDVNGSYTSMSLNLSDIYTSGNTITNNFGSVTNVYNAFGLPIIH